MENDDHKKIWIVVIKFVLWGTVAVIHFGFNGNFLIIIS